MPPIEVVIRRGGTVEARHRIHAVAVRDGEIVASAGDPRLLAFMRSSSKPLQALPLALELPKLPEREIAIACASHEAGDEQLERVRALNDVAARRGQTLAQLAITWVLRDARVTSALVGASSVEQLEANVAALDAPELAQDELAEVENVLYGAKS